MRLYTYAVTGRGLFPFDMLRSQCAWPADEKSAEMLSRSALVFVHRWSVELESVNPPLIETWRDTGWTVVTPKKRFVNVA